MITGVGFYNDPSEESWIAPLDFATRWNDRGYDSPANNEIGVLTQDPINGRHGFPFHESCWLLLEKANFPNPISLKPLF
jgi:hypothetical protein